MCISPISYFSTGFKLRRKIKNVFLLNHSQNPTDIIAFLDIESSLASNNTEREEFRGCCEVLPGAPLRNEDLVPSYWE